MSSTRLSAVLSLTFVTFVSSDQRVPSNESRLVNDLLTTYSNIGTVARPLYNSSQLMTVQFGMRLIQLDIIEKEQLLQTSVWLSIIASRWIDEYLNWQPDEYGGIQQIVLPWNLVWTPDVVIVNTASTKIEERPADIMVTYQGAVFWSPQRVFHSACLMDVTNFPYDRHTCHMWFQSMARYRWQLDIWPYGNNPFDLDTYLASFKESQEWEVLTNITERFERPRDADVMLKFSRRVALRFTLTVQRRIGYTGHLLMLPCVFLGFMTLVIFCLPPDRPDRHTLATSLFGSFIVLTLILVEIAPPNSASIPKLGMYYACNMSLVMLSVFLSGFVVNVSRRGDRGQHVPRLLKIMLIDVASKFLMCHDRVSSSFKNYQTDQNQEAVEVLEIGAVKSELDGSEIAMDKRSEILDNDVPFINQRHIHKARWDDLSFVLDRLFFVIFLVTLLVSFMVLFPRPPSSQNT